MGINAKSWDAFSLFLSKNTIFSLKLVETTKGLPTELKESCFLCEKLSKSSLFEGKKDWGSALWRHRADSFWPSPLLKVFSKESLQWRLITAVFTTTWWCCFHRSVLCRRLVLGLQQETTARPDYSKTRTQSGFIWAHLSELVLDASEGLFDLNK